MNYAIYTKEGKRNRKDGEYEDAVITLCGPPDHQSVKIWGCTRTPEMQANDKNSNSTYK